MVGGLVVDEGLAGVRLTRPQVVRCSLDLIDVEDGVEPQDEKTVLFLVALVVPDGLGHRGPEDDLRPPFAGGHVAGGASPCRPAAATG